MSLLADVGRGVADHTVAVVTMSGVANRALDRQVRAHTDRDDGFDSKIEQKRVQRREQRRLRVGIRMVGLMAGGQQAQLSVGQVLGFGGVLGPVGLRVAELPVRPPICVLAFTAVRCKA